MRRALALLALIAALAAPAFGEGPEGDEIYGLTLGQRAPDPSDTGGLQTAFGSVIAKELTGLMYVETGIPHYLLNLGESRTLGIWFDASKDDRPIYWLDLTYEKGRASAMPKGRPDLQITTRDGVPLQRIDIAIDTAFSDAQRADIKAGIENYLKQYPPDDPNSQRFARLPPNDPNFRVQLLGTHFRGRMTSIYAAVVGRQQIETELFDAERARRVLSSEAE